MPGARICLHQGTGNLLEIKTMIALHLEHEESANEKLKWQSDQALPASGGSDGVLTTL